MPSLDFSSTAVANPAELPLVSIVIPAFNQAQFLVEAVESVFAQNYPRIELIVLDDGSSDDTPSILERYRSRIRWERHLNMGQARTLNKGWDMSRGEVLSYLAADDYLLPCAVLRAVECLRDNPGAVLCYCDYNLIDSHSRFVRYVRTPDYSYHEMVVGVVCAPGPGVFFRRAAYEQAGHWNPMLRQIPDFEYWLRLGLVGSFTRIPEPLAAYRVHDDSRSFASVSTERAEETLNVISGHIQSPSLPRQILDSRNEALSSAHVVTACFHLRSQRYRDSVRHLWAALKLHPPSYLRRRTYRLILNGLFNRLGHRVYRALRRTPDERPTG